MKQEKEGKGRRNKKRKREQVIRKNKSEDKRISRKRQ
jgi:hypothetical protein